MEIHPHYSMKELTNNIIVTWFCIHACNNIYYCLWTCYIYELAISLLYYLQDVVCKQNLLEQSCSNILESFLVGATNTESFGLMKPRPSFGNNKGFFKFLVANASSTIDFLKAPIDEGIVDSPPSKDSGQIVVCSLLPLRSSRWNGICRASLERYIELAQPRKLYRPSHVASAFEWWMLVRSLSIFDRVVMKFSFKLHA